MARRTCCECGGALTPITVVDQLGRGSVHRGLAFTFDERPRTGAWSGKLENQAGTLEAWLCERCGRAAFYAS